MAGANIIGNDLPVGTKEEIQRLNLPLNNHATCSRPTPGNKGCRFFEDCKYLPIRDGKLPHLGPREYSDFIQGVGSGPDRIGFQKKVGSTGAIQGHVMTCAEWYESGGEDRLAKARQTGDAYGPPKYAIEEDAFERRREELIAAGNPAALKEFEGRHTIKQRIRVEVHRVDPDPKCPDCKKGECRLTEERVDTVLITPLLRPGDAMKEVVFGNEITQEMMQQMQQDAAMLGMQAITHEAQQRDIDLAPAPPSRVPDAGKGSGVAKLRETAKT